MGCGSTNETENVKKVKKEIVIEPLKEPENIPESIKRAPVIIKNAALTIEKGIDVFCSIGLDHCFRRTPGDLPEFDKKIEEFEDKFLKLHDKIQKCLKGLMKKEKEQIDKYYKIATDISNFINEELRNYVELIGENFNRKKFGVKEVRLAEFQGKKSVDNLKSSFQCLCYLAEDIIKEVFPEEDEKNNPIKDEFGQSPRRFKLNSPPPENLNSPINKLKLDNKLENQPKVEENNSFNSECEDEIISESPLPEKNKKSGPIIKKIENDLNKNKEKDN